MFDYSRLERWVTASHALHPVQPFLVILVQGLGRLDVQLVLEDPVQLPETTPAEIGQAGLRRINNHTLSYLWVLGAYELIRTVAQISKQDPSLLPPEIAPDLRQLKKDLERIRIPLAKLQPASRHKDTDFSIAFPAIHPEKGFAWQVSDNVYISRRDLADSVLSFLDKLLALSNEGPRKSPAAEQLAAADPAGVRKAG